MKKILGIIATLTLSVGLLTLPAAASSVSPALPATTSWTNGGLVEMFRVTGRLSVSLDGLGLPSGGAGTFQVDKPSAGAKVVGAYLTVANNWGQTSFTPTDYQLLGQSISFTHTAQNSTSKNLLADVTSVVKSTIDSAAAGIIDIGANEGAGHAQIDGASLMVIFDDPNSAWGSAIFMFGNSDPTGASFSASFDPLGANQATGHWMSLGISFSCQPSNLVQRSHVSITTSANATPVFVTKSAGGADDSASTPKCANSALVTVGGVGDSRSNNPGSSTTFAAAETTDDELYELDPYLAAGDTSVTFETVNPSNDDNIFQAVIFLNRLQITGAVVVDDPQVTAQVGTPNINNVGSTPSVTPTADITKSLPKVPRLDPLTPPNSEDRVEPGFLVGETALATGSRLEGLTSVVLGGISLTVSGSSRTGFSFEVPALPVGLHDIVLEGPGGKLTFFNYLRVTSARPAAPVDPAPAEPETLVASKTFSGFAPGSPVVTPAIRNAIQAWLSGFDTVLKVEITGYTMGPSVKRTDRLLALNRARNASAVVTGTIGQGSDVTIMEPVNELRTGDSVRRVLITVIYSK